jgi:hypothetical protein
MVAGITFSVENRQFDPAVVRVEPNAPDDSGDPRSDIVELRNFRVRLPRGLVARFDRRTNSVGIDMFVDRVLDAVRDRVGLIEILFQVSGKYNIGPRISFRRPYKRIPSIANLRRSISRPPSRPVT